MEKNEQFQKGKHTKCYECLINNNDKIKEKNSINIDKNEENIIDYNENDILYVLYSAIYKPSELYKHKIQNKEELIDSKKDLKSNNDILPSFSGDNKSSSLKPDEKIKINGISKPNLNKQNNTNKKTDFVKINLNDFYLLDEFSGIEKFKIKDKNLNNDDYFYVYYKNNKGLKLDIYEKSAINQNYYSISIFNSLQKEYRLLFTICKYPKGINEMIALEAIKNSWCCEYFNKRLKINFNEPNIHLSKRNNDDRKYDIIIDNKIKSNNIINANCNGNNIMINNNNCTNDKNINNNNNNYNINYNNCNNNCNNNNNNYSNNNLNNNYNNNLNNYNNYNTLKNNYNNNCNNNNKFNNNFNNNGNNNANNYNNNLSNNGNNSSNINYNNNLNNKFNYNNNSNNSYNNNSNNSYNNNSNNNYNNNFSNNNTNNNKNYSNNSNIYNNNSNYNHNNSNNSINYSNNTNSNNFTNSFNNNNNSNNFNNNNINYNYNNNPRNSTNNNINNNNSNYFINNNNIINNQINNNSNNLNNNFNTNANNYYTNSNNNNNNNENYFNFNNNNTIIYNKVNKQNKNNLNNYNNINNNDDYYNDYYNDNYNENNENNNIITDDTYSDIQANTVIGRKPKKKDIKPQENINNISYFFPLVGLNNVGATCFMNATLQCLLHVSELSLYFLKEFPNDKESLKVKNSSSESHGRISEIYYDLVNSVYKEDIKETSNKYYIFKFSNNKSFAPKQFKTVLGNYNPQFKYNEANDSKDLILYLLQTFHDELNYMGNVPFPTYLMPPDQLNRANSFNYFMQTYNCQNFSIASKLFYGTYENRTKCLNCGKIFFSYQKFEYISFPTQKYAGKTFNILDGFKDYCEIQDLYGDNQYYCQICQGFYDGKICCNIIQPPCKLVINIDYGINKRFRVRNLVIEEIIDITKYINFDFGKRIKYQISGICTHLGSSGSSGHYIAFCRNKSGKWYNFNDSSCSESDRNTAFTQGNPYLLIYEQI